MTLSPDKKTLILTEPKRDPATTATKVDEADTDVTVILGKWEWNHNGTKKNGEFILKPDGKVWSSFGGDTGAWKKVSDGQYMINLRAGSVNHIMNLSADKKTFVLI